MNNPLENNRQPATESHTPVESAPYEPPCIESVMTSEDIEREVQYAGVPVGSTVTVN